MPARSGRHCQCKLCNLQQRLAIRDLGHYFFGSKEVVRAADGDGDLTRVLHTAARAHALHRKTPGLHTIQCLVKVRHGNTLVVLLFSRFQ